MERVRFDREGRTPRRKLRSKRLPPLPRPPLRHWRKEAETLVTVVESGFDLTDALRERPLDNQALQLLQRLVGVLLALRKAVQQLLVARPLIIELLTQVLDGGENLRLRRRPELEVGKQVGR